MKARKLYVVEVVVEYVAFAADEVEATHFAREAVDDAWLDQDAHASEWRGVYPSEWDDKCNIYHNIPNVDLTVPEALALMQSSPTGTPATNMQSATVSHNDASPSEPNAVAVNLDAQEQKE